MQLDIRALLGLSHPPDVETSTTLFYTHVPHIGTHAYHHILFKPRPDLLTEPFAEQLELPRVWCNFLKLQNGAGLFSSSLEFYGLIKPGELFDRKNFLASPPFSLVPDVSESRRRAYSPEWIAVGCYSYDHSNVLLHRTDGSVRVVGMRNQQVLASWSSAEEYLLEEFARLSTLFSPDGTLLANKRDTVPRPPTDSVRVATDSLRSCS